MKWIYSLFFLLSISFAGESWAYSGSCSGFWSDFLKAYPNYKQKIGDPQVHCASQPKTMAEEMELLKVQGKKCSQVCDSQTQIAKGLQDVCKETCAFVSSIHTGYIKGYYHGVDRGRSACIRTGVDLDEAVGFK